MSDEKELRAGADRRRQPRGGRRPADVDGFSPLVMVVGNHAAVGDAAEAVLAQLKFAVVPAGSVDDALRIMQTMRPDIVTANAEDAARIGRERPEGHAMVVVEDAMRDNAQLLVDEIRSTLRASATGSSA
jgi:hypothetical protein